PAVHAGSVADKKQRDQIDQAAAKASSDIKDCGHKMSVTFDWHAYDSIDWAGLKKDKVENMPSELSNLQELGMGINKLCADKDYKAAMGKISKIVYRPTNNDKIKVKAQISGDTMTLENYSFGSTRHADDYETAAKASL